MLMLSVDIHQLLAKLFDLLQGTRPAVDVGPRAGTVLQHTPKQTRRALVGQIVGFQPGVRPGQVVERELRADLGAGAAFAYDARVAALAQNQSQCIDQDRFARAGLARERSEARLELEIEP